MNKADILYVCKRRPHIFRRLAEWSLGDLSLDKFLLLFFGFLFFSLCYHDKGNVDCMAMT